MTNEQFLEAKRCYTEICNKHTCIGCPLMADGCCAWSGGSKADLDWIQNTTEEWKKTRELENAAYIDCLRSELKQLDARRKEIVDQIDKYLDKEK